MIFRRTEEHIAVRCGTCPGMPLLPTPCDIDTAKCLRCQDRNRPLPVPHPEDHLCDVCRRECPGCGAPSAQGGRCRTCRGLCRTCHAPLPARTGGGTVREEPRPRNPGERASRRERVHFPRTWLDGQCETCRNAPGSGDPVRAVLAALPDKVVRACGGTAPPTVIDTIRAELRHHTTAQLVARVERRWWGGWSSRPLSREADERRDGYRPDHVAVWLLTPGDCPARCDDGWTPGDPDSPCPLCGSGRPPRPRPAAGHEGGDREVPVPTPADRTPAEAVAHRPMPECEGRNGTCGVPVAAPYTMCPSCLDWPRCACGRRYDPQWATACTACAAG
ncbi:hypothetical protein [Streptomyces sp. CNQ085]|uniref:hypothetical protein n=1 Tax=Streptomyces sp. CNQ085 TaxID=2886944 RepID=UPI001F513E85|nr:hypothetical protein [Streptomyces sp. CNQ085]MCI0383116.1 hypothetical protein [Streptomyces sp. CNQ085]